MKDRFMLEEQIMDCWGVCEDIQTVIDGTNSPLTTDQLLNILIGMKELYHLKFSQLFDTFEECVRNREI